MVKRSDRADQMLEVAAEAFGKAGVSRKVVFGDMRARSRGIAAYSVDPADPKRIVREEADGSRTVGHLVGGQFKAIKAAK